MEAIDNTGLLQTVFDSAPNGIAVLQAVHDSSGQVEDFSILLFNAYTFNWINTTDYKGKRFSELFPMVRETGILEKFIQVAATGLSTKFESRYTGEGMNHWFRFTAVKQAELLVVTTEDITERKEAEAERKEAGDATDRQKRIYDSIINATPDLVYVFDLNYTFTYANKALLSMWGKKAEDAIGKGLRDNGYEEWHALMHEREIDEVVATGKSIRGTVSFPHAELGSRVYDYIFVPVFNEKGEVEAIAGTTRDITELKRAEECLQQSESRFRKMIEQSPVGILLSKGEDVTIENINTPMLRFMNKETPEAVLGKKMLEVLPELEGQPALQKVLDVQRTGLPFRGEEQAVDLVIEDRLERRYFDFSYNVIPEAGGEPAVMHMAIDVTEQVLARRKLEDSKTRLKSMIDQTPAPTLVLMGEELVVEQINAPMLALIGHGPEVIGLPLIDIIPELEGQYIWDQVLKVYREGIAFDQSEVRVTHHRAEGIRDYYYNIAYRPLKEEDRITGMIQVAIDVTEQVLARKKLEESEHHYKVLSLSLEQQVSERTRELQRSNGDLQQFAHVASHDLKEPVRKIKTFISRLEQQLDGKLDETSTRFIERIQVATNRMYTMIDGVLNYSTINAGKQRPESVDLNEVLRNIENDLEIALQEKGASLVYRRLPVVQGAPVLLYQLFYNLVNNAIKFARSEAAPHISLSSEQVEETGKAFVRITMQDNGIGFNPGDGARIFEAFIRLNAKDQYEGTGLGLSLCKKITERHGGSIEAEGKAGEGAVFTIMLPLEQKQELV